MWLADGEQVAGSWSVYLGEESPTGAKITGKLHVTDRSVLFEAGLSLEENAGVLLGDCIQAFTISGKYAVIPFAEIVRVRIKKKSFLLKSLVLTLASGEEVAFHFGALPPKKALAAIQSRIGG